MSLSDRDYTGSWEPNGLDLDTTRCSWCRATIGGFGGATRDMAEGDECPKDGCSAFIVRIREGSGSARLRGRLSWHNELDCEEFENPGGCGYCRDQRLGVTRPVHGRGRGNTGVGASLDRWGGNIQ